MSYRKTSHAALKPHDKLFNLSYHFEIWLPLRVKFQSDTIIWISNLAALVLHDKTCYRIFQRIMMTSSDGKKFRVTDPLCREFTGHRWIPRTKASDAELWCVLWSAPWINGWVHSGEAGDLRRNRAHYDVIAYIDAYSNANWQFCTLHLSVSPNTPETW